MRISEATPPNRCTRQRDPAQSLSGRLAVATIPSRIKGRAELRFTAANVGEADVCPESWIPSGG